MLALGQQTNNTVMLTAAAVVILAALAGAVLLPALLPWSMAAAAGLAVVLYLVIRGEIHIWAWLWILSYGLLDRPVFYLPMAGFFNLTIPRMLFALATAAFFLHFLLRDGRPRVDRPLFWAMIALLAYIACNASAFGWQAALALQRGAPYYRFLGSLLFPFLICWLVYCTTRRQKQILWALIPLTIYGWYALYIGYLQYAAIRGFGGARAFIWPGYINLPNWGGESFGIHFDRARGAYTMVYPQSMLLIFLFFADLYLIRKLRGPYRAALIVQALLIPPAIFFTGLRAGYLAFLLCGVVWCLWACRPRVGRSILFIAGLGLLIVVIVFWSNVTSEDRAAGGVGQVKEVVSRIGLAKQAILIATDHPFFGAGWGHFAEAQFYLPVDPGSDIAATIGRTLTQHNVVLGMLSETGIVGVLLLAMVFWMLYRESLWLYRRIPERAPTLLSREFVVLFWVALLSWGVHAMFSDPFWDVPSNALLWATAGLMLGYNRLLEPHPLELTPLPQSA